tara:strand:- start:2575 stop:2769 length:195 start_codon:yes stop_codon:yes gene_type:complete
MNFGVLSLIYWFAGFGLVMHGIVELDPDSTLAGVGLFVVAMIMLAAVIFDVPMNNKKNQLDRGE